MLFPSGFEPATVLALFPSPEFNICFCICYPMPGAEAPSNNMTHLKHMVGSTIVREENTVETNCESDNLSHKGMFTKCTAEGKIILGRLVVTLVVTTRQYLGITIPSLSLLCNRSGTHSNCSWCLLQTTNRYMGILKYERVVQRLENCADKMKFGIGNATFCAASRQMALLELSEQSEAIRCGLAQLA